MNSLQYDIGRFRDAKLLLFLVPIILIPWGGEVGTIATLQVNELLVPAIFILTIADFATRTKDINRFKCAADNLLGVFVLFFIFIVLLNYIRNPLLPSSIVESSDKSGGFKTYYHFAIDYLIFLIIVYWSKDNRVSARLILRIAAGTALFACVAGILIRFAGISIPGLDSLTWSAARVEGWDETRGAVRVGVLDQFGQLGLLLTLSGVAFNRRYMWVLVALFFGVCIYLGGGRVSMMSTFAAIMLLLFLKRKYVIGITIVVAGIVAVLSMPVLHELAPTPQLKRLTNIGSLEESSVGRFHIYRLGMQSFLDNPLFGSGYGESLDIEYIRRDGEYKSAEFIEKQLRMGGHATHLAILKNMGIAGYIPFMLIWLYIITKLLPLTRSRSGQTNAVHRKNAQFIVIMISALLIRMLVEGNGSELHLYLYAGIAGVVINEWLFSRKADAGVPLRRDMAVGSPR